MYRIRRFGVIRTATVVAVMYAIAFAVVFVPIALFGLLAGLSTERGGGVVVAGILLLGVVLLVVYPILIWVVTALACLVYNLAARWVGGIEVDVERRPQAWTPGPAWTSQPSGGWVPGPGGWMLPPTQAPPPDSPTSGAQQEGWPAPPTDARKG